MKPMETAPSKTHRRISKLAIAGGVVGPVYIVGLAYAGLVWLDADPHASWFLMLIFGGVLVAPFIGVILSITALIKIRKTGGALGGGKIAKFGLAINIFIIVFFVVLTWVIRPLIS
jgi:hypothetical protein